MPQWFAAVYTGLVASAYTCLLINGFVGFQFAEDGTPLSLWVRSLPSSSPSFPDVEVLVPPNIVPRCMGSLFFRCHCYLPTIRRVQIYQAHRAMDYLHPLASYLHRHLYCFAAHPRVPHA
jgi:hypothetical protein